MSIYRLAFIESLNGQMPADAIKSLADTYEANLAAYAAGEYLYVKKPRVEIAVDEIARVHALHSAGASIRAIARQMRMKKCQVQKLLSIFPPTTWTAA